jgi:MFS family permease
MSKSPAKKAQPHPAAPTALTMAKGALAIVFSVQLVTAIGNTGMQSVLPAIGRQIGIPDFLIAGIFSLSALLWALCSPYWAKSADKHGRKPLILLGMAGFAVSMMLCSGVVAAGLRHLATPLVIFLAFLLARAIFGFLGSAAPPASQAYLADHTGRGDRTSAIAALAAAFGMGTAIGPAIAPLFAPPPTAPKPLAAIGLSGPMIAFSLIAFGVLIWVWRGLPEVWPPKQVHPAPRDETPGEKPPALWKDPNVQPFLIYGLLVASCQTAQYQTLGFLVIDTLKLPPLQAQSFTAAAMMSGAVAGMLAQWGLIKVFQMSPRMLMRWGALAAAVANLITAFAPNYFVVAAGFTLSSLGYGLARPGYSAGASLAVDQKDQARAAGAVAAVNGLNTVIAPLFVLLYERSHPAPYLTNMVILVIMLVYTFRASALTKAAEQIPASNEAAAEASLERNAGASGF